MTVGAVAKLLRSHAAAGEEHTHTSMGGTMVGRFQVPTNRTEALMEAYGAAIDGGATGMSLVERHREIGPIVVDVDLRHRGSERVYTASDVEAFVPALAREVRRLVAPSSSPMRFVVLEKPAPRPVGKGKQGVQNKPDEGGARGACPPMHKDGVHVVCPDAVTRPEVQVAIRRAMLSSAEMSEAFGRSRGYTGTLEETYDEAVIKRNGWMMYGSKKPDERHAWTATRVYWSSSEGEGEWRPASELGLRPSGLARLLSIRRQYDETPLTAEGERALARMLAEGEEAARAATTAAAAAAAAGSASYPAHDGGELRELASMLSDARAFSYEQWIHAGMALHEASGGGLDGLAAWTSLAERNAGKFEAEEHARLWRGFGPRSEARRAAGKSMLGAGALHKWAKEDSPERYGDWLAGRMTSGASEAERASLLAALRARFPELGMTAASFRITGRSAERVEFEDAEAGVAGHVEAAFRRVSVRRTSDGATTFAGLLHRDVPCEGTMTDIHAHVPVEANRFVFNQDSEEAAEIRSVTPGVGATLTMHRPSRADASVSVSVPGKPSAMVKSKAAVATLRQRLEEALSTVDRAGGLVQLFLVNNGTINCASEAAAPPPRRTDEGLVESVLEAAPKLRDRMKFAPASMAEGNCNGLFVCDERTSVWSQQHNVVVEAMLVEAFRAMDANLDEVERRHVESRRGRADMRHVLCAKVHDDRFLDKLDGNLDVFAVDNGCFDTSAGCGVRPMFRPIRPDDCVSTTAGWSYDADAAKLHRGDVEAFFERVLPVPEERRVVLAYFASLLSGRRTAKKFPAFTDERDGDNGKSKMMKLFQDVFGKYADGETGTKFVCRGSFDRDKNSHDAGTEKYRGKRLVIAEELSHSMTLDEAMLKRLSGGGGVTVGGRRIGTNKHWQFVWQAGFALIFNRGQMPKFDHGDAAFVGRVIAVPMRAKFVERHDPLLAAEPLTYEKDAEIDKRFPAWRSAVMDALLDRFEDASAALESSAMPASMRDLCRDVLNAGNPVASWCERTLRATGSAADFVVIRELVRESPLDAYSPSRFAQLVAAHFSGVEGVRYRSRTTVTRADGSRDVGVQDVLWGVAMV